MAHTFPRLRPLFVLYSLWLWWATMYLSHHYAVDLVAGGIISATVYYVAKSAFLPRMQPGKMFRWEYEYVERGEAKQPFAYGLAGDLDEEAYPTLHGDSDEWTLGSSSSFSPASRSPSAGFRSPLTADESWEGDTLASGSDSEGIKS
jgi:hypothetical protein